MTWGSVAAVLALAGCGAGSTSAGPDTSTSSSPVGATTPSASERDLGPDPGIDGYRTLDLCALVPAATLRAAFVQVGGAGQVKANANGPASCRYALDGKGAWAHVELAVPRDELPADVRTTDPGTNKVDATEAGLLIHDPASAFIHVLSPSGYVLRITGPGDTLDAQRLAMALGTSARERLTQAPPKLAVPDTAVSGRDLCEAVRQADVVGALGLEGDVTSSVDGRLCGLPNELYVSFYGEPGFPSTDSVAEVRMGRVTAQLRPPCELVIPLQPAPEGAGWNHDALLAQSLGHGNTDCGEFVRALTPLVAILTD